MLRKTQGNSHWIAVLHPFHRGCWAQSDERRVVLAGITESTKFLPGAAAAWECGKKMGGRSGKWWNGHRNSKLKAKEIDKAKERNGHLQWWESPSHETFQHYNGRMLDGDWEVPPGSETSKICVEWRLTNRELRSHLSSARSTRFIETLNQSHTTSSTHFLLFFSEMFTQLDQPQDSIYQLSWDKPMGNWIGLMENLQETMGFYR